MAVRRIPIHNRSVTGKVASPRRVTSIRTESSLETDFVLLMEHDPEVLRIEEQPVRISYEDEHGKTRRYTPDFLVMFRGDDPDMLVEIKYQQELDQRSRELTARFSEATKYAQREGWTFEIFTEHDIRGNLLCNLKFLKAYTSPDTLTAYLPLVMDRISALRFTTPRDVLASLTPLTERQAQLLPALWHLVSTRQVEVDLSEPLTMISPIWPAGEPAVTP